MDPFCSDTSLVLNFKKANWVREGGREAANQTKLGWPACLLACWLAGVSFCDISLLFLLPFL